MEYVRQTRMIDIVVDASYKVLENIALNATRSRELTREDVVNMRKDLRRIIMELDQIIRLAKAYQREFEL